MFLLFQIAMSLYRQNVRVLGTSPQVQKKTMFLSLSILHFVKGKGEYQEGEQLWPSQGYRWVQADLRITPGPADLENSESGTGKSGKPEKPFPPYFALLQPNQGSYRHGRGTHGSGLT